MSERYNVAASDVLGENYKITNIVCSDYNPNIDSTITVTVSVDDVYGDAISGETVTVTCTEGTFTQLNGSDITSASSVTGTTNSSGQFTLTYSCTEWGLITFSANSNKVQVKVKGFKKVQDVNSNVKVYSNGIMGVIFLTGTVNQSSTEYVIGAVNSAYAPLTETATTFNISTSMTKWASIRLNRNVVLYSPNTGSTNLNSTIVYVLATPLY